MVFTIEPMVNAGKPLVKELNDGWTVVTQDQSYQRNGNTWLLLLMMVLSY
jgi:methionine aminopeptidase